MGLTHERASVIPVDGAPVAVAPSGCLAQPKDVKERATKLQADLNLHKRGAFNCSLQIMKHEGKTPTDAWGRCSPFLAPKGHKE